MSSVTSQNNDIVSSQSEDINGHGVSETTPLLSNHKRTIAVPNVDITEDVPLIDVENEPNVKKETIYILKKAIPVTLTYVLQMSLQVASIFTLGHLGSNELAASALASMFATVTGWSIIFGASTALDTLGSQAYTSGNPKMVGIYLQRAIIIIMLGFIPISFIWLESEHILVLLGQDQEISSKAGLFLQYLLLGAPAFLMFEVIKKYLQAQGIMHASTYVLIVCSPINIFLNYILVWYKPISIGFIGAPIATAITYWLMFILILIYTKYFDGYQSWGGWSRAALQGWKQFLLLSFPGILMVCSEWWAFELVALAAGYLGSTPLATQSIVLTTVSFSYQFPFGVAVASSNRVGNLLGAGLASRAKLTSMISLSFAVFLGLTSTIIMMVFRNSWGYMFTSDEEVVRLTSSILPLVAFFQVSDGIGAIGCGILRGQGRQKIGAMLNVPGYYFVAFPVGITLAFYFKFGLVGLWCGLAAASLIVGICLVCVIFTTDWQLEVELCQKRIKGDHALISNSDSNVNDTLV